MRPIMCPGFLGLFLGHPTRLQVATRMWGGELLHRTRQLHSLARPRHTHISCGAVHALLLLERVHQQDTCGDVRIAASNTARGAANAMLHGGAVIVGALGSQCKSGTSDLCSWDVYQTTTGSPRSLASGWSMFLPPAYKQLTPQVSFDSMRTGSRKRS
jgi:hypothetical protein